MPIENLNYQGINRAITDYGSAGACEELINLRPTGTGLIPVKPFHVKMAGVQYQKVFVHKATNKTNYIGVYGERDTTYVKLLNDDGQAIATLFTISPAQVGQLVPFNNVIESMRFSYVGNYILFSIKDDTDEFYANYAFLWNGTSYEEKKIDAPDLSGAYIEVDEDSPELLKASIKAPDTTDATKTEIVDGINSAFNSLQEERSEHCFGAVIVALAFKTNDGKTFWTDKWLSYNPLPKIAQMQDRVSTSTKYILKRSDWTTQPPEEVEAFYEKYDFGLLSNYVGEVNMAGSRLSVVIPQISGWDEDTSILRSVEIYASKPVIYTDPSIMVEFEGQVGMLFIMTAPISTEQMRIGDQLLYYQKSVPLEKLLEGPVTEELVFGGNIQTTHDTLKVDAGAVTRYGDILSYNARFHYFKSASRVEIGMPDFFFDEGAQASESTDVFVVFNDGQKDIPIYCGVRNMPAHYDHPAVIVIAPSIRVKKVITQQPSGSEYSTSRVYQMKESSRYNYSYCDDPGPSEWERIPIYSPGGISEKTFVIVDEPGAINVTEQYNPFVFKVEHSYLAPGNILDVQPQMVAVRDVSFGDYPLNVFTDRGVYALLQGNGDVLYGNLRSVSNLITTSNSIPTEIGTFFIAAGGLWLVSGDNAVLVSDALSLGPHKFIRDCTGYQAIESQAVPAGHLLSDPTFEVYVDGAKLSYNRFRDELIVSNPNYFYSYVLSLKYRQWFKMGIRMFQNVPGSNIATIPQPGNIQYDIVDFSDETEGTSVLVHMQTRPFSFSGYMYSHIHRAISMVRAALSSTDILVVSMYGSDDLQEWVLLSYAGQSSKSPDTPLRISQLRTPPAARSWRYYTICIGGTIPTDTDFGPMMVDYQPVIRRLG